MVADAAAGLAHEPAQRSARAPPRSPSSRRGRDRRSCCCTPAWRTAGCGAAQIAALAQAGFRAHAYDRRGFGDTLHADDAWSHLDDLVAVLDGVAARQPAILVGCSQGGRIAIDAALAHPGACPRLVLVAPAISGAPSTEDVPARRSRRGSTGSSARKRRTTSTRSTRSRRTRGSTGRSRRKDASAVPTRELFLAMNEIALRAEVRGTQRTRRCRPRIASRTSACPMLVAWGDLDFPDVIENCAHLARSHPAGAAPRVHGRRAPAQPRAAGRFDRLLVELLPLGDRAALTPDGLAGRLHRQVVDDRHDAASRSARPRSPGTCWPCCRPCRSA